MNTDKPMAVQFHVLPQPARGRIYKVVAVAPDGYGDIDEIDFGPVEGYQLDRLGRIDPWAFRGQNGCALREHLKELLPAGVAVVEVTLPPGPVAAMNWEEATPSVSVIRRPHNEPGYLVGHVVAPFRVGVYTLSETPQSHLFASDIEQLLKRQSSRQPIVPCNIRPPSSFRDYLRELEGGGYHGVHILLNTEVGHSGRHIRVGGEDVPLETFIAETARANKHFVVLHDTNPKPSVGIPALRWDSQKIPEDSATAFILLAAPKRNRQAVAFLDNAYARVFCSASLVEVIAPGGAAAPRAFYAGAVANPGIVQALDVGTSSTALKNRLRYLHEQRDALAALYPEQSIYNLVGAALGSARFRRAEGDEVDAQPEQTETYSADVDTADVGESLDILRQLQERVRQGEREVEPVVADVISKADPDKPRYPAALFYLAGAEGQEAPVPKISSISPAPPGLRLELHFWIDMVRGGIDYRNKEWPILVEQESSLYPIELLAEVWSEDFHFDERRQKLSLPKAGPTAGHARFPLTLPDPSEIPLKGRRGEVYIFLQYQAPDRRKELVAVFRVETLITREPEEHESAQMLEHTYLATNWFKFKDAPVGSSLTIFLAKKAGHLQVFTLNNSESPWGRLGASEQAAYQVTREIYRAIHRISLAAAAKKEQGQSLSFKKNADDLAQLGYRLFSEVLFSAQTDTAVMEFHEKFLTGLPEHSTITIALNRDVSNFIIPWGLMYDRRPPPILSGDSEFGSLDRAKQDGFWGVRYNLSVRPSSAYDGAVVARRAPVRLGAAWHGHEETLKLKEQLEPLEKEGRLVVESVKAEDQMIPALVKEDYDLVQFFCHGYTSLPDKEVDANLVENYKRFVEASHDRTAEQLLMAINSPIPRPSFMLLKGGAVTLPVLNVELKKLPGQPIVLLSMCESAQVTCAGAGFVTLFLDRGARSVVGTEGPTLWSLGREMDVEIIRRLLAGQSIGQAFSETRRALVKENVLALIYSLFGDAEAKLTATDPTRPKEELV